MRSAVSAAMSDVQIRREHRDVIDQAKIVHPIVASNILLTTQDVNHRLQ